MRFDVVTLFPEMFSGYLGQSLLNRAIQRDLVSVQLHNLRDWSRDKHQTVDDRPFGGGPGMVLKVDTVVACVEDVQRHTADPGRLILLTPQGTTTESANRGGACPIPSASAALRTIRRV